MRKLILSVVLAGCVLAGGTASAQHCLGRASFSDAPWQVRTASSFSPDARSFGAAVLRGSGAVFGGPGLDITGYRGLEETAATLSGTIGVERRFSSRVHACPIVTVQHQFGPNVTGADLSANVASFGGRIGIVASENQVLQVIPMIGMDAQTERDSVKSGADTSSSTRTFTVARLGVGFVLNRKTSLVPELIELFGVSGNTTFRLTAAFSFGK
jgi:hypothetical protein